MPAYAIQIPLDPDGTEAMAQVDAGCAPLGGFSGGPVPTELGYSQELENGKEGSHRVPQCSPSVTRARNKGGKHFESLLQKLPDPTIHLGSSCCSFFLFFFRLAFESNPRKEKEAILEKEAALKKASAKYATVWKDFWFAGSLVAGLLMDTCLSTWRRFREPLCLVLRTSENEDLTFMLLTSALLRLFSG